jgi:hypothetical protein
MKMSNGLINLVLSSTAIFLTNRALSTETVETKVNPLKVVLEYQSPQNYYYDGQYTLFAAGNSPYSGKRLRQPKRKNYSLAQRRSRPRQGRTTRRAKRRSFPSSIKANAGILSGVPIDDTILAFGGDYSHASSQNLTIDGGVLYWSYSTDSALAGLSLSVLTFDVGPVYHIPISKSATIDLGGRAGINTYTIEFTVPSLFGSEAQTVSDSKSDFGAALVAGISTHSSSMVFGAELRKPIISGDGISRFAGMYILGNLGFVM